MIDITIAGETLFKNSTEEELKAYHKELGVKFHHANSTDTLRRQLCKELGLSLEASSPVAQVLKNVKQQSSITPDYNLEPEGIWGGKRIRIRVSKPADASDRDVGTHVFTNGSYGGNKQGYPIKYNEVQVVPMPIYRRLQDIESQTAITNSDLGNSEFGTTWTDPLKKYHVENLGIEPSTESRAESMKDWYAMKGPKWFAPLTARDLGTVCTKLGIDAYIRNESNKRVQQLPGPDMLSAIMTFLYGYPEVIEEAA